MWLLKAKKIRRTITSNKKIDFFKHHLMFHSIIQVKNNCCKIYHMFYELS